MDTEWGTGILDPRELERFLGHEFAEPLGEAEVPDAVQAHVLKAMQQALSVHARRERTEATLLRLERLRTTLQLQPVDVDVILVCLLGELDGRYRRLFAYLADERWVRSPSVGLLAEILRPGPTGLPAFRARFAQDAPLVRHRVVRVGEDPAVTEYGLSTRSVTLDGRIAAFLTGEDHLEGWLAEAVRVADPLDWDQLVLSEERLARPARAGRVVAQRRRSRGDRGAHRCGGKRPDVAGTVPLDAARGAAPARRRTDRRRPRAEVSPARSTERRCCAAPRSCGAVATRLVGREAEETGCGRTCSATRPAPRADVRRPCTAVGPAHAPPRRGRVPAGALPVTGPSASAGQIWARLLRDSALGQRRDRRQRGRRSPGRHFPAHAGPDARRHRHGSRARAAAGRTRHHRHRG